MKKLDSKSTKVFLAAKKMTRQGEYGSLCVSFDSNQVHFIPGYRKLRVPLLDLINML
jgi:hypothetical protein